MHFGFYGGFGDLGAHEALERMERAGANFHMSCRTKWRDAFRAAKIPFCWKQHQPGDVPDCDYVWIGHEVDRWPGWATERTVRGRMPIVYYGNDYQLPGVPLKGTLRHVVAVTVNRGNGLDFDFLARDRQRHTKPFQHCARPYFEDNTWNRHQLWLVVDLPGDAEQRRLVGVLHSMCRLYCDGVMVRAPNADGSQGEPSDAIIAAMGEVAQDLREVGKLVLIDPFQLKTEIENDPQDLGYKTAATWKSNGAIAELLNAPGVAGIQRKGVAAWELQAAVVGAEFIALSAAAQRAWLAIVGLEAVQVDNANLRAQILAIWQAGTQTRDNLAALQTKTGSRAEEVWGDGAAVRLEDVRAARAL